MKKIMLLFISVITVIITMFAVADVAFADTDHVKKTDIEWPVGNGNSRIYFDTETGTITGCSRYVQKVEIPEEINGKRVKKIGRDAFFNCIRLEEIVIPNSIESIGDCAFGNCALTEITIPESVKEIGHNPFTICKNLESINVSPDNVYYRSISGVLYDRDVTTVIRCPQKTNTIKIPNSVTSIGDEAFSDCEALEKVKMSNAITSIGTFAFARCAALNEIIIPSGMRHIARAAFVDCSLVEITIPRSVNFIGEIAFEGCEKLEKITVSPQNEYYASIQGVLYDKSVTSLIRCPQKTKQVSIPYGVTDIDRHAFSGCTALSKIPIPSSVKTIGSWAFKGCEALSEITIPDSVKEIGRDPFMRCKNLKSINVSPDNEYYRSISGVLYDKDVATVIRCPQKTKQVNIPNNITKLEDYAFTGCTLLSEISIPNSVESIGTHTFEECSSIKRIKIPPNVRSLEGNVFMDCTALTAIIIPPKVRYIQQKGMVFAGCSYLTYIIGEKNSYAEIYAKRYGYTFKTTNEYLLSQISKKQYGIFVYDSEGQPIPNASVTFGENAPVLTDENGLALCPKQTFGIPKLVVSCEGYITYTNSGENYQKNKDRYDIVVLSKDDEVGLKLNSAVYYNTSDEVKYTVDVLKYTKKLTLTSDDDITNIFTEYQGDVKFRLECEAVDKNAVVRYELWQNNKKMAESKDGKFTLTAKPFSSGKPIQVKTFNAKGRSASKTINLVITKTEPVKHTFEFGSKLKFKIGDSVPILGGQEIDIDLKKNIPIEFKISEDSVYAGFNISNFKDKDINEIRKEMWAVKGLGQLDISKSNVSKFKNAFEKLAKSETKGKFKANLIGYAEGKWTTKKGRLQEVKLTAYLAVKLDASVSTSWDWIFIVVPMTVQVDLGMEAVLAAEAEITFPEFSSSADLTATLKPYLEIYLGAGVGKLISAGGYAKGEIESEFVILGRNEPSGIKSVDATIEAGVKAYLGFREWEYCFASKTYNLYTRTNSPQMLMMHAPEDGAFEMDMYNAANYSLQDVSYLEDESEWLGLYKPMMLRAARNGQEGIQIYDLVTTTYENAQPSVASNQEKMVMAYLRGDKSRSVYNMTQVMYSVYEAQTGTWKEPKALDEMDITGDYAPRLYSDGTDIYLVYQDCNTTFDEESGADMGNFAKAQVIKIARFDNDTETFVDITSLSEESLENDCYNTDAVFGLVEGTPTVAWISNPDPSDVFRQNNTNAIQCSKFENGRWQKAETLVSNEGCITEVAVGDDGIAYVMDTDNQLNTADDRVLKLVQDNGVVSVAEGKVYGLSYTQLPGSENKKLTWMSKDGLKKYEGEALNIADNLTVASGYQVIDNDIYYVMSEGNQANLYKRVYDANTQTWADPVQLTESERYVEALTVTKFGDDVFATLLNTDLTTEGEAVNRNCNLGWTKLNEVTDLAIISAEYESEQVKPGAELPIQIKIKNNGTTKIEKVNVTIKDTDGTAAYSNVQDVLLASGEEGFVEAQITMPETIAQTNYTVTVTTEKADKNFADNEATFTVGYTDLSVGYEQAQIGDKQFLYMTVTNESYVPSGGKLEVKYGEEVTFETEIEELINGESTTVAVGLSDIMLSNGSSGTISVNVTADKEETSLYNNQELVYMDMDYQISYFANIKNNEEAFYEAVKVYDEALAVTEACPTRKGYRLIGWSTDRKASEPEYRIGDSITTNQALTLYGVWEENTGKSGILYGDVDENFKIDATDVLWIERYLAAWEPYAGLNKETADLNEDGMIDLKDVTILERYLAKWKGYGVLPLAI